MGYEGWSVGGAAADAGIGVDESRVRQGSVRCMMDGFDGF